MVDAADQKRMRCAADMPDPTEVRSGSEPDQCTDRTEPAGTPPLSSLRRRKRPHRLTRNGKCHSIPRTLAKTSTPWRQNARHGPGHARTRRDRIRRQELLQPRTSTEQLTESGQGNDQDHDSGDTQLQAGCAGSGFADSRIRRLERLIIAAKTILEAGGAQVPDSGFGTRNPDPPRPEQHDDASRAQLAELQNQNHSKQSASTRRRSSLCPSRAAEHTSN